MLGQKNSKDSLQQLINSSNSNFWKIQLLNKTAESLWLQGDYKESETYLQQAFQLEEVELQKKQDIIPVLKEKAISFNNLAIVYRFLGNYSASIENHLKALEIREKINDTWGIARSNLGLGSIYDFIGKKREALNYKFRAKALFEKANDSVFVAITNNHIGGIYFDLGKLDSAKFYNGKAFVFFSKTLNISGLADASLLAGQIFENTKEYDIAIENYEAALNFKTALGSKDGIIEANYNLGTIYIKLNQLSKAQKYLESGLNLAQQVGSKIYQRDIYKAMSKIDSISGNYANSLRHYKLYVAYRDSLINEKATEKITNLKAEFENIKTEEKRKLEEEKKEIIRKQNEQQQKSIIYGVSAGLLFVCGILLLLYRSFRLKKQSNVLLQEKNNLIEEKQKEIKDSINYAERIQRSFLASKKHLDANLSEYFIFFKPKDIVSGDFYWSANLINNNFAFIVADSTGHGVPGAIMSLLNITSLEKSIEIYTEPSDILNSTRKIIIDRLKKDGSTEGGKDGMDCALFVFDFKNMKLKIAAANNPVWIVRNAEIIEIKPDKMPVGKHERQEISFKQIEVELQKGDIIYALTDGYPDQFGGENGKKFMIKNLRKLILSNANLPMNEQKAELEKKFTEWIGNIEQVDDITVVGIKV